MEPVSDGPGAMGGPGNGIACCGRRHSRGGAGRGAMVEPAVIAALLREGGHGYDIKNVIAELSGDELSVDHGGLYRVLRRLEEEGFVSSVWVEGESGPQRREYQLTLKGRELATDWIVHLRERERLAALLANALEESMSAISKR